MANNVIKVDNKQVRVVAEAPLVHRVVAQVTQGPPGPPGPPGASGGSSFVFEQATPSSSWIIDHNLQRHPGVTVTDSSGNKVFGDVSYPSNLRVILTFGSPFAGAAYLN